MLLKSSILTSETNPCPKEKTSNKPLTKTKFLLKVCLGLIVVLRSKTKEAQGLLKGC